MSEQNKALVRRVIDEVWNGRNFAYLSELVAGDIVIHGASHVGDVHGPEGIQQYWSTVHNAFSDLHFTIEDQIAEGDRVVTRWSARGTHTGEFEGIPPTARQVSVAGIDIDRFANGKNIECWTQMDELGLLQQLGALPAAV